MSAYIIPMYMNQYQLKRWETNGYSVAYSYIPSIPDFNAVEVQIPIQFITQTLVTANGLKFFVSDESRRKPRRRLKRSAPLVNSSEPCDIPFNWDDLPGSSPDHPIHLPDED